MAWRLDINGIDVSLKVQSCTFTRESNERPTATIVVDGEVSVAEDDEVVIYAKDGTTPLFGGLVSEVHVSGARDSSGAESIDVDVVSVRCVGWERFFDWCSFDLSYSDPVALEDLIDDMMDTLTDYGLTYAPSATGITLAPFTWTDVTGSEALRQLRQRTNRIIRVRPDKSIEVTTYGGASAPFVINNAAMAKLHRFEVRNQPTQRANVVKGTFGPTGAFLSSQEWIANGSDTSWVTDIPATSPPPPLVLVDDGNDPFLATVGDGGMFEWSFSANAPYGTLQVGTYGTPANGVRLKLGPTIAAGDPFQANGFTGVYPFTIRKGSGSPPREYRFARPEITEYGAADEVATQVLASVSQGQQRLLLIETDEDGFDAGQALTVDTTDRGGIDASFLVGRVTATLVLDDYWRYAFEATEGTEPLATQQERTRQALGGSGGGTGGVSVLPSGGVAGGSVTVVPWAFLGGSRNTSETIDSAGTYEPVPQYVDYVAPATYSGRVRVQLRAGAAGQTVTARLLNVTDGTTAGTSDGVTGTTFTEKTFVVTITKGKRYRLAVTSDTSGGRAYAIGSIESA